MSDLIFNFLEHTKFLRTHWLDCSSDFHVHPNDVSTTFIFQMICRNAHNSFLSKISRKMARTRKTPIYPNGKPDNGTIDSSDSPTPPPHVDIPTCEKVQPTCTCLPRQAAQLSTPPTGEDQNKNKKSARKMASPGGLVISRVQCLLGIKPALKKITDKIPITKNQLRRSLVRSTWTSIHQPLSFHQHPLRFHKKLGK